MDEKQRAILNEVAEGRLSPEAAEDLLYEAEQADRAGDLPRPPGVRRVRVVGALQLARVVGDPTVREAVAEGPHVAQRDGDTLVITGRHGDPLGPGPGPGPEFVFGPEGPSGGLLGLAGRALRLTVRMHPELALEVQLEAGSLSVEGVSGPLRATVEAGSARIERFRGPLDLAVEAGSVQASGVLDQGASHIHCQAGSVGVHLERGSSVRIAARSQLGRVALPGESGAGTGTSTGAGTGVASWSVGGATRQVTVGAGSATLDVEAELGNVTVTADR
jgi:hypothetical protein